MKILKRFTLERPVNVCNGDTLTGIVRTEQGSESHSIEITRSMYVDTMVMVELDKPGNIGLADGMGVIFGRAA